MGFARCVVAVDGGFALAVSEQRTILRLQAEVRALEYELTAAKVWLSYQADEIYRLRGWHRSSSMTLLETQAELARGEDS